MRRLNPSAFESILVEELRTAWGALRSKHPNDHFYSFGVYTTSLAEYLSVTASTEEGLSAVTASYVLKKGGDEELQRASLRWSPCDSPLHSEGDGTMPRASKLREEGPDPYDESETAVAATESVFAASIRALQRLDAEGLFGQGNERESLVVSIWMGDQSDEDRIHFARKLNTTSIADRFASELNAGNEAFEQLSAR